MGLRDITGEVFCTLEWKKARYERCLKEFGPDAKITQGYRDQISRIKRGVADKTLEEIFSERPVEFKEDWQKNQPRPSGGVFNYTASLELTLHGFGCD